MQEAVGPLCPPLAGFMLKSLELDEDKTDVMEQRSEPSVPGDRTGNQGI